MSARQLSLIETTRFGLPLGGRWFRTEEAVVTAHSKKPGYLLAWDVMNKGKIFGIYQDLTLDEFARSLDSVPHERRHGYQLMLATEDCPGYMILQWRGKPDPTHETLLKALKRLRKKCCQAFAQSVQSHENPTIVSYCSTRPISGKKERMHSYYVVVKNMIFNNNHDGFMQEFFDLGMKEIQLDAYTENRTLLLPNCRSYGAGVSLTKLEL